MSGHQHINSWSIVHLSSKWNQQWTKMVYPWGKFSANQQYFYVTLALIWVAECETSIDPVYVESMYFRNDDIIKLIIAMIYHDGSAVLLNASWLSLNHYSLFASPRHPSFLSHASRPNVLLKNVTDKNSLRLIQISFGEVRSLWQRWQTRSGWIIINTSFCFSLETPHQ